jgi:hypothetical protein
VADRVDAAMDDVQAAALEPMRDRVASQARIQQLAARDRAVLRRGEPRNPQVNRLNVTRVADPGTGVTMCPHRRLNVTRVGAAATGVTFCRYGPSQPDLRAPAGQRARIGTVASRILTLPPRRCSRPAGRGRATSSPCAVTCGSEAA